MTGKPMAERDPEPWGDGDPIAWARATGRLMPQSVARWRADYEAAPAETAAWLRIMTPTREAMGEAAPAVSARVASRPARRGAPRFSYAANPVLAELDPAARAAGNASGAPAPTLFATGDVPSFTASGVDPESLLAVPWQARHVIAAAPTRSEAYELAEAYADSPESAAADFGGLAANVAYRQRVQRWGVEAMSDDQVYKATFGEDEA